MNDHVSQKSFGELPTWGREEPSEPEVQVAGPSWREREMSEADTLRPPEDIRDDGRTDAARRWTPGEEILDRYMVERELGQGGMGVVYGCLDKVAGVPVAVKCLPPELSHNSVEMEEVRENFELVYKLGHPNIASVRTLERNARGEYFLVMEVAEGENLRAWLRRKWKAGGVPLAGALPILRQVAAALDYAHGKKVVHRDVKPGNVMIDARTGEVKVLDFGLAAQIRTSLGRASHAYRGTSGTGPYMAPEQWLGKQQDGAADQYALGVMAYEMLAGHLPFENSELAVLKDAVLHGTADSVPGLPKRAMAALRRAMAKRKEARFGSCAEFVDALAGERHAGSGRGGGNGRWNWVAALVLAAGVGVGVWWWEEHVKGTGRLERMGDAVEEEARPEGLPHRIAEEAAAEKRAEAEKVQREQAARETAESQRKLQETEQRAQEAIEARKAAEAAKQKAEEEAERPRRELEERLAKLEQQASSPVVRTEATEAVRPEGSPHQAGETKTIILPGGATMEMVWCPPGSFMMGSPPGEEGRFDDETQHHVTLTEGFWMAKTEVTQGQWNSVMGMTVQQMYYDYPMYNVSWEEAQEFCRRAWNGLQLPTEAQWEYACRAGSTGEYGGTGGLDGMGWYSGNSTGRKGRGGLEDLRGPTHPVGLKQPNAWGLYDMHGNVLEWCADWYASDLGTYKVTDPKGPVLGSFHVCRGGCWDDDARSCRSAFRGNGTPGYRHDGVLGFRPVRVRP